MAEMEFRGKKNIKNIDDLKSVPIGIYLSIGLGSSLYTIEFKKPFPQFGSDTYYERNENKVISAINNWYSNIVFPK